jgi:hypothetical protein
VSCNLGEWCCGAEAFSDAATCPAGVADGACFLTPEPWCRTCETNDDCADVVPGPSNCYELKNGAGDSIGKFCSVGCSTNADCPRGLQCHTDLPTDQDGVTISGCIDTLCAAIDAARP